MNRPWRSGAATARAVLLLTVMLAACATDPATRSGPFPEACSALGFSSVQCNAIVGRAMNQAGVDAADVGSASFVRFDDRPHIGLGGSEIARVQLVLDDGRRAIEDIWCVGVGHESDRVCNADARIVIYGGVDHDVPCSGEPPAGCATLPPSPRPAAVAAALPLRVRSLSIPLDHVGHYDVEVGAATLPDGALSVRRASLVDPSPSSYWIDDGIRIEVRPDLPGRPRIGSVYRAPFDGPEPVHVHLVFDVVELEPGGVMALSDIEVR